MQSSRFTEISLLDLRVANAPAVIPRERNRHNHDEGEKKNYIVPVLIIIPGVSCIEIEDDGRQNPKEEHESDGHGGDAFMEYERADTDSRYCRDCFYRFFSGPKHRYTNDRHDYEEKQGDVDYFPAFPEEPVCKHARSDHR